MSLWYTCKTVTIQQTTTNLLLLLPLFNEGHCMIILYITLLEFAYRSSCNYPIT